MSEPAETAEVADSPIWSVDSPQAVILLTTLSSDMHAYARAFELIETGENAGLLNDLLARITGTYYMSVVGTGAGVDQLAALHHILDAIASHESQPRIAEVAGLLPNDLPTFMRVIGEAASEVTLKKRPGSRLVSMQDAVTERTADLIQQIALPDDALSLVVEDIVAFMLKPLAGQGAAQRDARRLAVLKAHFRADSTGPREHVPATAVGTALGQILDRYESWAQKAARRPGFVDLRGCIGVVLGEHDSPVTLSRFVRGRGLDPAAFTVALADHLRQFYDGSRDVAPRSIGKKATQAARPVVEVHIKSGRNLSLFDLLELSEVEERTPSTELPLPEQYQPLTLEQALQGLMATMDAESELRAAIHQHLTTSCQAGADLDRGLEYLATAFRQYESSLIAEQRTTDQYRAMLRLFSQLIGIVNSQAQSFSGVVAGTNAEHRGLARRMVTQTCQRMLHHRLSGTNADEQQVLGLLRSQYPE